MKRWPLIIAVTGVLVWLVVDTVREFFANQTIQYFTTEPRRLFYVAAIGIVGGFTALGFDRLPVRAQKHVRVFAWGAAASTLTVFAGSLMFCLSSLSSLVVESGGAVLALVTLLLFSGITAYLWFEFYRALKIEASE